MNNRSFINKITESATKYPTITFSRKRAIYTCVNPFSYHMVRKSSEIFNQMDGLYVDGILMCLLIKWIWKKRIPRLSFDMSGMAADLFERLNNNSESIYFVGAKKEKITATISQIKTAYPQMNISGYRNGYFVSTEDRTLTINKIVRENPDFVIVGMGSPIQEQFCIDLKSAGYQGIAFTCGGFLHQTSNNIYYYPKWINKLNLRAFYRLYKEKGLWKRLPKVIFQFPILFIWDSIFTKLNPGSSHITKEQVQT